MDGLGRCVLNFTDAMEESIPDKVVASIGATFIFIAEGIHKIVLEQDSMIEANAEFPSVLRDQLIVSGICTLLQHQILRQTCIW